MNIAILIPMHNESLSILKLHEELSKVLNSIVKHKFKIILVDDGSTDNTVEVAASVALKDERVEVVELSRNFGKEIALSAGIDRVDSDAVIIMDADLQHPPIMIPAFIREWENGFDIVVTKRLHTEKQPIFKKIGSSLFYKIINSVSEFKIEPATTDFRLLDKKVIVEIKKFSEKNRIFRGLVDWLGFKKTYLDFVAPERYAGEASYSYKKLFKLAVDGITSFSLLPLKIASYLGVIISVFSALLFLYMLLDKFFIHWGGFTPLAYFMVANTFLIGVVLMCLGIMAIYIGNIHVETINRPLYVVRRIIKK